MQCFLVTSLEADKIKRKYLNTVFFIMQYGRLWMRAKLLTGKDK